MRVIAKAEEKLEELMEQPFVLDLCPHRDYTIDADPYIYDSSRKDAGEVRVTVTLNGVDEAKIRAFEADYDSLAKPFETWLKKYDIFVDGQILSGEDSLTFEVTVFAD